jgi:methylmalonyl-CoA mutase N-terminal domain/subunit
MRERFGAKDPKSLMLRFHTQTAGSTLQARQIDVNVVRVTMQALSAVLGGTQSLHTNGRDEALNLPSRDAAVLALRTQQVLAHETGVADTIDPLGGSYFVEALTDAVEREALAYIERIDELGGAVRAIERGFQQHEIHDAAYTWQKRVERDDAVVVGVNRFVQDESVHPEVLRVDENVQRDRVERLRALRERRDSAAVESCLARLGEAARGDANVMPPILDAVEAQATLGEIADVLRAVFDVHRESFVF